MGDRTPSAAKCHCPIEPQFTTKAVDREIELVLVLHLNGIQSPQLFRTQTHKPKRVYPCEIETHKAKPEACKATPGQGSLRSKVANGPRRARSKIATIPTCKIQGKLRPRARMMPNASKENKAKRMLREPSSSTARKFRTRFPAWTACLLSAAAATITRSSGPWFLASMSMACMPTKSLSAAHRSRLA
jgi:hypothetical protein